jgi:hypothetical protein
MRSLRLAMMDHGIPKRWTHRLANALGIKSVEDLVRLKYDTIMIIPKMFRQNIIDLRNAYLPDNMTLMYESV